MDFEWLRERMEKLDAKQDEMSQTLIRNTASLEEHIKRTNILEDYVKKEIPPLKRLMDQGQAVFWALGIVGSVVMALHSLGIIW